MALGLIVRNSTPNNISSDTSKLFFYVGGIAALTLILNATTAKSLLYFLGLLGSDSLEKTLVTLQVEIMIGKFNNFRAVSFLFPLFWLDEETLKAQDG